MKWILFLVVLLQCHAAVVLCWSAQDGGGPRSSSSSSSSNGSLTAVDNRRPYFDLIHPRNVSSLAGDSVTLRCRVYNLHDKVVSWVRRSDLAILASAGYSHTSDARISASHDEALDDWLLHLSDVNPQDSGYYECQVNTEPKINFPVYVHVEAARAFISGSAELYIRKGSSISVTCTVSGLSAGGSDPFWLHESQPILVEGGRRGGGVSLETERLHSRGIVSRLIITKVSYQDGGNYTCAPPSAVPASVIVHVINGEHPAAMQRGNRSANSQTCVRPDLLRILFAVAQCLALIHHHL